MLLERMLASGERASTAFFLTLSTTLLSAGGDRRKRQREKKWKLRERCRHVFSPMFDQKKKLLRDFLLQELSCSASYS